jgi:mono/diheme cytochrome c family protein
MPEMFILIARALMLPQSSKPGPRAAGTTDAYTHGKNIFVSRCASCHDADGSKKLPDGTTLLVRLTKSKNPEARLGTRLKNEQERHDVMLYVQPLLSRVRSSQ